MIDTGHHRSKEALHLGAVTGGQAHCPKGHAVIGATTGNDFVAFGKTA